MNASPAPPAQAFSSAGHPWRNSAYRRWLLGATVSLLGDQCYLVALPWLILQLGSPGMVGSVMMAGALPRAALMLLGGVLTDRVSARLIVLATSAVRAVCVAAIGALAWLGTLASWEVYALVIAFGIADAFALPAQSAFVPSLISREQLVASTSLQQVVAQLTGIAGPLVAALAIARLGLAAAFWADAMGFLAVIGVLVTLPDPPLTAPAKGAAGAIADGIAYVRRDRALWAVFLLVAAMNLCTSGPFVVGVAALAKSRLHLSSTSGSSVYGVLIAVLAAGGLVGALVAGVWKTRRRGALILGASALVSVCLMTMALARQVWSAAVLLAVLGATAGVFEVNLLSWVMQRIEPGVRGRVSSVLMLSSLGILPVSMAVAGFLARWGADVLFIAAGACMLAATGAAACSAVREIRE